MVLSKKEIAEYQKKYRAAHKIQRKEYDKNRYIEDKGYFQNKFNTYYSKNKNVVSERARKRYIAKRDVIIKQNNAYTVNKRKSDTIFNMRCVVSNSICAELKKRKSCKNGKSCLSHLPYSITELKIHLEKQFLEPGNEWMTWGNWGKYNIKTWDDNNSETWTWNIDHIIPQSKLPYTSMEDDNFKKCWALENLRPLSSKQNVIDGGRR